jgi:hypothetical protein
MSVRAVARSAVSSGASRVPGTALRPRRVAGAALALLLTGSLAGAVAAPAMADTAQTHAAARFSPEMPEISSVEYPEGEISGGVGVNGSFTIDSASLHVATYKYSMDSDGLGSSKDPERLGGPVTVEFPMEREGSHMLYAQAVDRWGRTSDVRTYRFTVDFPASPANWHMDQFEPIPGSTDVYTPDAAGSGHSLRLSEGVGRAPGPFALNQRRPEDQALTFDGTAAGAASTAGPLVRMFDGAGFSASAFVRADDVTPGSQTVVSQDGEVGSGFRLERLSAGDGCPDGLEACWGFRMYTSDGGSSVLATSDRPVTAGEWVHLTGVFKTSTNELSLSVCPVPVDPDGRDPEGTGIPVVDPEAGTVAYTGAPWLASGSVQVGRSQVAGAPSDHWNGAIDEVRLYGEPLSSGRIMRICTGSLV